MSKVFSLVWALEDATGAGEQAAGYGQFIGMIGMIVVLVVVFYFFLYRPQKKQERETTEMRNSIELGDVISRSAGSSAWSCASRTICS